MSELQPPALPRVPTEPSRDDDRDSYLRAVLTVIAVILVVAALKLAQSIIVPVIVAVYLAIFAARPMVRLQRRGVGPLPAVAIVVLGMVILMGLAGWALGGSINAFVNEVPAYEDRIRAMIASVGTRFPQLGISVSVEELLQRFDPSAVMGLVGGMLVGLQKALANTFLVLFMMIFILLESSTFPIKVRKIVSASEPALQSFTLFADNLNRYLVIKTVMSLLTGVCVAIWLAILGVDFAIMWGFVAFLLNYIPAIGSALASVPPILLALVQFGPGKAILVAVGYMVVNSVFGNLLETRFMGRGLGMSALVVFLSLIFWAWVFGPVGMLLAVPLTMTMKLALQSSPRSAWVGTLLEPGTSDEGDAADDDQAA